MIKFENVSKIYDNGFKAVDEVSFKVREGEFLVIIGPSGSGKSTTLKMINRIIQHTSGKIEISEKDIKKLNVAELRRGIGYVIQQIGLFPHYTIGQNVGTVPQLKGWDKEKIRERTNELLNIVGLEPDSFFDRYPKQLSGGQQQRVGVARALASDPDVILMDEPFGALDPITREQLQEELISLHKRLKKTFVFVTHDMDEALKLGDRIAIMKDGKLLQIDTPEKILHEPAHGFVEEFIGKHRIIQNPDLMSVKDVMKSEVITMTAERSPERALATVRQHNITHLIIIGDDESMLGVVSAYKLIKNIGEIKTIEELIEPLGTYLEDTATAKDAILKMHDAKTMVIPVLDERHRVKGLVTRGTLLKALSSQWTDEMEDAE